MRAVPWSPARIGTALNYRHHFHAGNFADLLKHAVLLELIAALAQGGPLSVAETHAGAGLYALDTEAARRSGEAEDGVARLLADPDPPAPLAALARAVRAEVARAGRPVYPGSPLLAARALRPGDRYLGCELRAEDQADLARTLAAVARPGGPVLEARLGDGYAELAGRPPRGRTLVLVDPPFERPDDYDRAIALSARLLPRSDTTLAIWAPLKDLETYDRFLAGMEAVAPRGGFAVQLRLRPLDDPMRLNGCVLLLAHAPDVAAPARSAAAWIAARLGGPRALARVEPFAPAA